MQIIPQPAIYTQTSFGIMVIGTPVIIQDFTINFS